MEMRIHVQLLFWVVLSQQIHNTVIAKFIRIREGEFKK